MKIAARKNKSSDSAKITILIFALSVSFLCATVFADSKTLTKPEDFQIVKGDATFSTSGNTLTANITTPTFIANVAGNGIQVPDGMIFQINQPTPTSWALFRDISGLASTINGLVGGKFSLDLRDDVHDVAVTLDEH